MDPNMRKNIIAGVLFVVAIGVVIYQLGFAGGTPPPDGGGAPAPAAGAVGTPAAAAPGTAAPAAAAGQALRLTKVDVNIDELLAGVKEVTFDYDAMRIDRDPLAALVGGIVNPKTGVPEVFGGRGEILRKKITGIIFDANNPLAVVDDEVVGVGYTYPNGVKVQAIEKDKVIFQLGDSLIPVEMKEL